MSGRAITDHDGSSITISSDLTLEEIAALINGSHDIAEQHFRKSVNHALAAGHALLQARELIPSGEWTAWCRANLTLSDETVRRYSLLALHHKVIERHCPSSIKGAELLLRRLDLGMSHPGGSVSPRQSPWSPEIIAEVKRLHGEGWPITQIEAALGGSPSRKAISYILDPQRQQEIARKYHQKRKEQKRMLKWAREQRLKQEEAARRRDSVQTRGKSAALAYSLIRQALQALQCAYDETGDADFKKAISSAMQSVYNAEEAVGKAA